MTTVELLDRTIRYALSITLDDADTTERRARVLQMAQEVYEDVWYYRLWKFRKTHATVSIDSTGLGLLPIDFLELGKEGRVYSESGAEIEETQWNVVSSAREQQVSSPEPGIFALAGLEYSTDKLQLQLPTASTQNVVVYYERKPLVLVDMDKPTVALIGGGITGTFYYKTTYVTANGESEGSRVSDAVVAAGSAMTVTVGLGPTGTTSRKVYRTLTTPSGTPTIFRLVATIADNTTLTTTESVSDVTLAGNALLTTRNSTEYGLERIPVAYHYRVLIPGVRWRVLDDIPDSRAKTAFDLFESGKSWMAAVERPRKGTLQKLPRAIPRGMW